MNWLDLAIIVLAIILVIVGIRRGFMTSMLSHFPFGVNALISFFLYKPIGFVLDKIFNISGAIAGGYSAKFIAATETFSQNLIAIPKEQLNGFVSSALNESGMGGFTKWLFNVFMNRPSLFDELHEAGIDSRTLAQICSETYAKFFMTIISFAISMLLLFGMVMLFRLIAKKLRQVGFVKVVDNILGAFYGIGRCLIILVILSCIIKILSPISWMHPVTDYINGSFFGKLIYNQISDFFNNLFNFNDIVRSLFGAKFMLG